MGAGKHGKPRGVDGKALALSLVLGILLAISGFAMCVCIGYITVFEHSSETVRTAAAIVMTVGPFVFGLVGGYAIIRNTRRIVRYTEGYEPLRFLALDWSARAVAIATAIMLVLWLPYLILQFPGSIYFDTAIQFYQFQTSSPTYYGSHDVFYDASYVDHHPVCVTLLYGAFLTLGDLVGSQNAGIFTLVILQSIVAAAAITGSICYTKKLGVPKVFRLVGWLFCALFPVIPLWQGTIVKDSLFSPLFVIFLVLYFDAFRTKGESLKRPSTTIWFVVVTLLCILTKKAGLEVVAPSLFVLLIYCRAWWKQALAVLVIPLIIAQGLIPAFLYPAIGGVEPGGKQEAFGFAMQQMITVVREANDLTESESAALEGVLDVEAAKDAYDPQITDPVKDLVHPEATTDDYLSFLKAYATVGLRHPILYAKSILSVTGAMVCPGMAFGYHHSYGRPSAYWWSTYGQHDVNGELHITMGTPEPIAKANNWFNNAFDSFMETPPMLFLFGRGMFGGWIPLICIVLSLYGGRRFGVAFVPVMLSIVVILLSPAGQARYVLPMLYTTPLMLGMLCYALNAPPKQEKMIRKS